MLILVRISRETTRKNRFIIQIYVDSRSGISSLELELVSALSLFCNLLEDDFIIK